MPQVKLTSSGWHDSQTQNRAHESEYGMGLPQIMRVTRRTACHGEQTNDAVIEIARFIRRIHHDGLLIQISHRNRRLLRKWVHARHHHQEWLATNQLRVKPEVLRRSPHEKDLDHARRQGFCLRARDHFMQFKTYVREPLCGIPEQAGNECCPTTVSWTFQLLRSRKVTPSERSSIYWMRSH